jgi:hypothetical protein
MSIAAHGRLWSGSMPGTNGEARTGASFSPRMVNPMPTAVRLSAAHSSRLGETRSDRGSTTNTAEIVALKINAVVCRDFLDIRPSFTSEVADSQTLASQIA